MTPTQRQAMEMALEALDQITDKVDGTGFNRSDEFNYCLETIDTLRAALAEQEAVQVPAGWKLVPVVPTERMIFEGSCAQSLPGPHYISESTASLCWAYMPAAVPEAPQPAKPVEQEANQMAKLGWQAIECDVCGSSARAYPRPEQEPLTDEDIQDLLKVGNPTEDEYRLIRIGWDAAHSIKPRNTTNDRAGTGPVHE